MKRWASLAVTVLVMCVIFVFSGQPGEQSSDLSNKVTKQVELTCTAKAVTPAFFSTNPNANVRKWAHVYIYCALGASMALTVQLFLAKKRPQTRCRLCKGAALAVALCTLYACFDEFHQSFIPDRSAQLSDVGVDALGFIPCALLVSALWYLARRLKTRPRKK